MKIKLYIMFALTAMLFTSCSKIYQQLYETKFDDDMKQLDNYVVYENEDCTISYDFWSMGGEVKLLIYNKTDSIMYIDLANSFFIKNGRSYQYFRNRQWSETTNRQNRQSFAFVYAGSNYNITNYSVGTFTDVLYSNSLTVNEQRIMAIAPHSYRGISEYKIYDDIYIDCELTKYPNQKSKNNSLEFNENNTPLKFSNYLSYFIGSDTRKNIIDNKFYVFRISNYSNKQIMKIVDVKECGRQVEVERVLMFPINHTSNSFYNQYLFTE